MSYTEGMMNRKGFIRVGLAIAVAIIVFLGAYALFVKDTNAPVPQDQVNEGMQEYRNESFALALQYPREWHEESCDYDIALLVVFGDKERLVHCESDAIPESYIEVSAIKTDAATLDDIRAGWTEALDDVQFSEVTIGGVTGLRVDGTHKAPLEPELGVPEGTAQTVVAVITDTIAYQFFYTEREGDHRAEFQALLDSVMFLR